MGNKTLNIEHVEHMMTCTRLNYTQNFRLYCTEHSPLFLEIQTIWHCLEEPSTSTYFLKSFVILL